jgi:hypothetical protein
MAKVKQVQDKRSQSQKFIDTAREHGADGDDAAFRDALKAIAQAPASKPKKKAKR